MGLFGTSMLDTAVYGARGYLGRTLISCLHDHPDVSNLTPVSESAAGEAYGDHVPSLQHGPSLTFHGPEDPEVLGSDVAFLATASGQAQALVPKLEAAGVETIIDLSRDHRLQALDGQGPWVYGLPEHMAELPSGQLKIAVPGCYPTATLLGLAPLALGQALGDGPVISDGKSGISGAGATPRDDLHFPEANESLKAYKVQGHDHTPEITQALGALEASGQPRPVRFTPHLVPQNRGLLATVYAPIASSWTQSDLEALYEKVYGEASFVTSVEEPDTAHIKGTHHAHVAVHLDETAGLAVVRTAIDNLVRGGAGNAVHAMNLALGLQESHGLPTKGVAP